MCSNTMKASKCLQGLVLKDIPVRHGAMTTRFLCPTCVSRYYYLDKGEIKSYIIYLDRLEWNQMLEMNMIACLKEALSDCLLQTDNWYIGQNFDPFIFLKGCHGDDWKSSESLWSQRELENMHELWNYMHGSWEDAKERQIGNGTILGKLGNDL